MKSGQTEILSLSHYLELKESGAKFDGQSYLFWEYVRILHEVNPDFFLLENVVMAKKWQKIIDETIGIRHIQINSSLLSAQNRPRLYWTNIKNIEIPVDKNVLLKDILDKKAPNNDKVINHHRCPAADNQGSGDIESDTGEICRTGERTYPAHRSAL